MKVIDNKGMIFGKINIIDAMIILFAFSLLPMIYFGYMVLTADHDIHEKKLVKVDVVFADLIPELVTVIKKGDIAKDPFGKTCGYVVEVKDVKPSEAAMTVDAKTITMVPHPYKKNVSATLNLLCLNRMGVLYYNDAPMKIGQVVTFSTDTYVVAGLIHTIEIG